MSTIISLYNKVLGSYINICLFLYMLAIAGRTAGPNWLKYFEETHGGNKKIVFLKLDFLH